MLRRGTLLLLTLLCAAFLSGCSRSTADVAAVPTEASPPTAVPTTEPSSTLSPPPATPTPGVVSNTPTPTPLPPVRMVSSYPIDSDKALVPDRPLVIVFDRPMNPEAVANAMTLSPAVEGVVEWPEPNRMVIRPAEPWAEGDHTLTLPAEALGNAGEPLEAPLVLRYSVGGRGVPVPILMYHAIEDLDEGASASEHTWTVAPAAFAEQMAYLLAEGWTTIAPGRLDGKAYSGWVTMSVVGIARLRDPSASPTGHWTHRPTKSDVPAPANTTSAGAPGRQTCASSARIAGADAANRRAVSRHISGCCAISAGVASTPSRAFS